MKKRKLLISLMTLALCLTMIAGGTFALYTDNAKLENHLQAGSMDITLTRTNLITQTLSDKTGFLETKENTEDVDFSKATDKNVFDVTDQTKIVPGSSFKAELVLENKSDVAFNYYVEIVYKGGDDVLANQLKVTVNTGSDLSADIKNGLTIGSATDPIDTVAKGEKKTFYVQVEFLDLESNNEAQGKNVQFDLIVYAIQALKAN